MSRVVTPPATRASVMMTLRTTLCLAALLACHREHESTTVEVRAPAVIRLLDNLRPEHLPDRPAVVSAVSCPEVRITVCEAGEDRQCLVAELPHPVASTGGVPRLATASGQAPSDPWLDAATVELLRRQVVLPSDKFEVQGTRRGHRLFVDRIALHAGESATANVPGLPAGTTLSITGRFREGREAGGELAVFLDEVPCGVLRRQSRSLTLPASAVPRKLRLEWRDDPDDAESSCSFVSATLRCGPFDRWLLTGPGATVERVRSALENGAWRLRYRPALDEARVSLAPADAWRIEEHGDSTTLRFLRFWPAGTGVVERGDRKLLRAEVSLDGQHVKPLGRQVVLTVEEGGWLELEVHGSAADLDRLGLRLAEALWRRRFEQDRLTQWGGGPQRPLVSRVQRGTERRVAVLLRPGGEVLVPLPDATAPSLDHGLAVWTARGEVPVELSVSLIGSAGERTVGQETLLATPDGGFDDRRWALPAWTPGDSLRLRFTCAATDGGVPALREVYAAIAQPLLTREQGGAPVLVLTTVDTLRADAMSLYGADRPTTPVLDSRRDELVVFDHSYSVASWTRPSTASILTGLHPSTHGAVQNGRMNPEVQTLAERLYRQGWATRALVMNPVVGTSQLGFEQGFERFVAGVSGQNPFDVASVQHEERLRDLFEHRDGRPLFVYLHLVDPHTPYDSPEEVWRRFDAEYDPEQDPNAEVTERLARGLVTEQDDEQGDVEHVRARYDACVRMADRAMGMVFRGLEESGLDEQATVVLTSDHGEEFLEHGNWYHGYRFYEEQVRVPLVLRPAPGLGWPAGVRQVTVQSIDLVPTLLATYGLPSGTTSSIPLAGMDLTPWLRGERQEAVERPLLFEEPGRGIRGIRVGPFKLIEYQRWQVVQLFNLQTDPLELQDLAAEQSDRAEALGRQLDEAQRRFRALGPSDLAAPILDPATLQRLEEVGY